ncbi:hypothetical protein ACEPAH_7425 [Sanghuangporus vaninii]
MISRLPPSRPYSAYITRRRIEAARHSSLLTLMASHYCLQVIRVEGVCWKPSSHGKEPNLYVEVKLGSSIQTTRTIKKCASPIWDECNLEWVCDFFEFKIKHKSTFSTDPCVGAVDIELVDLLRRSINGEAALVLSSAGHKEPATSSLLIVLHLAVNDAMAAAQNSIKRASEDVRRSEIQRLEGISDATQVVSGQSDLYKAVGDLLSKLSMLKDVVDVVSEIHPFLTIAWKLASALYAGVENVLQTDQKVINLVQMMIDAFAFVSDVQTLREKASSLHESINGLLKQTIECCLFVRQYVHRSFFRRMLDFDSSQKIDEFERALVSFKQQIDSGLVLHTAFVSMRTSQRLDDMSLLQRLSPTPMDGFHRPECLPAARFPLLPRGLSRMMQTSHTSFRTRASSRPYSLYLSRETHHIFMSPQSLFWLDTRRLQLIT